MWRGTVVQKLYEGRVSVMIPDLYRSSIVRDIQCSFDAEVGERVVVADLHPDAKVHDWWVVGRESNIGFGFGTPEAAHTHPVEEIDGLDTVLDGYVTDAELTTSLSGYTTDTELGNALSGKANTPGDWANCAVSTYIVPDVAATSPTLAVRNTPIGMQIRGRYRTVSVVPMDGVVFNLPTAFRPSHPIIIGIPTMGPGSAYASLVYQIELQTDGRATARQEFLSGARMSFNSVVVL